MWEEPKAELHVYLKKMIIIIKEKNKNIKEWGKQVR